MFICQCALLCWSSHEQAIYLFIYLVIIFSGLWLPHFFPPSDYRSFFSNVIMIYALCKILFFFFCEVRTFGWIGSYYYYYYYYYYY